MKSSVHWLLCGTWVLGGGTSLAVLDQQVANSWIAVANIALITLGGTAIVLSQRYTAARREEQAKDLAAGLVTNREQTVSEGGDTRALITALHERLDAVIVQRDRIAAQNDALLARVLQLVGPAGTGEPEPSVPLPGVPPS